MTELRSSLIPFAIVWLPFSGLSEAQAEKRVAPSRHLLGSYQAFSLRDGPWKLVAHNLGSEELRQELYHLGRDPRERHPVAGEERIRHRLARALRARLQAEPRFGASTVELTDETIQRLRSLGYLE